MSVLISLFTGFFSSWVPRLIDLYKTKMEMQHEVDMFQLQMEAQKQLGTMQLEGVGIQADADVQKALYATYNTGIKWVDALNGTVRPVIAYGFFLLYVSVKIAQFYLLTHGGAALPWLVSSSVSTAQAVLAIWGIADMEIWSAIIAFYYGNRVFDKLVNK